MNRSFLPVAALAASLVIVAFAKVPWVTPPLLDVHPAKSVDKTAAITYFIATGDVNSGYRSSNRELALWALQAWEKAVGKNLHFEPAPEAAARIRLYWNESDSGTYGEMRPLDVDGRPGAAVFIQPDVQLLGPDIARSAREDDVLRDVIVYLTCLHELGHALGLEHTRNFADIMYYFGYGGDIGEYFGRYRRHLQVRTDIANFSGLSTFDVSRIKSIFAAE